MSIVDDFQRRVAAATGVMEGRKKPGSQVALTEMQETAMRHKLMAFGVETFQRGVELAGAQPGMKWHFMGCGQSSYESEQAAFRAACEVVGVTPDAALRPLNGGTDRNLQTPRWFVGERDHTWSWNEDGRMEVKCRVVVDVANERLVAAQVWGYESWCEADSDQNDDLAKLLFVENKVGEAPVAFDLFEIDRLPEWATCAAGDQQVPPYQGDEVIGLDKDGCVVQWNSDNDMPANSGESLEEFGLHNLREYEFARVGVAREAWEAAVAEQANTLPKYQWTKGDSAAADARGWGLFESSGNSLELQLQRSGEDSFFVDDEAVATHVQMLANFGDPTATHAVQALIAAESSDVERFKLRLPEAKLPESANETPRIDRILGGQNRVLVLHTKESDLTFIIPPGVSERDWLIQEALKARTEAAGLYERALQLMARAGHAHVAAGLCDASEAGPSDSASASSPRM